jgi:hypothetical protein
MRAFVGGPLKHSRIEEVVMKRFLQMSLIFGAMAMLFGQVGSRVYAAPPGKDMSVVDIPDKTKVMKTTLQGKYIFIHDDEKMANGAACFYIYEYSADVAGQPEARPDKLVISFHCQPVQREKAKHIVMTYGMVNPDLFELREIQFAGSTEGHRVP